MRIDEETRTVELTERNLKTLLAKLVFSVPEYSACTIEKYSEQGNRWAIKAVPNEDHYGERTPGEMHPETEQFVSEKNSEKLLRDKPGGDVAC